MGAFSLGVSETQDAACSLGKSFHASHKFSNSYSRQELSGKILPNIGAESVLDFD
jgi:hypothetical protein